MTILKNTQWIRKQKAVSGTFGLEIETETLVPYALDVNNRNMEYNFLEPFLLKNWKIVEDHSLRNIGYEYVLTKPLSFTDIKKALEEFDQRTKEQKIEFLQDRHSTSVHVHMNFQNETFKTLGNYVTLFTLFEEVLVSFCGEERRSNFFCITTKYAEGLTQRFKTFFEKVEKGDATSFADLNPEVSKYSSLNIVPLYRQGSIEVRTMRGVTDVATIYKWVGMLNSLLEFARRDLTPIDIINSWRQEGMLLFCDIFEEYLVELGVGNDVEALIERNLWTASCIACSVEDWNTLDEKMENAQKEYDKRLKEVKNIYDAPMKMAPVNVIGANGWNAEPMVIVDDIEEQF